MLLDAAGYDTAVLLATTILTSRLLLAVCIIHRHSSQRVIENIVRSSAVRKAPLLTTLDHLFGYDIVIQSAPGSEQYITVHPFYVVNWGEPTTFTMIRFAEPEPMFRTSPHG